MCVVKFNNRASLSYSRSYQNVASWEGGGAALSIRPCSCSRHIHVSAKAHRCPLPAGRRTLETSLRAHKRHSKCARPASPNNPSFFFPRYPLSLLASMDIANNLFASPGQISHPSTTYEILSTMPSSLLFAYSQDAVHLPCPRLESCWHPARCTRKRRRISAPDYS